MNVQDLATGLLHEAPWNANALPPADQARLTRSLARFGLVQNLVVRPLGDGTYEVLSGNQRLQALRALGKATVPCVVVELSDPEACLLAQALNHIHGEDGPGRRAALLRDILRTLPADQVLAVLPETARSLQGLAALGTEDLASHLQAWERARAHRLHTLTFRLTAAQREVVDEALAQAARETSEAPHAGPNARSNALDHLARWYLTRNGPLRPKEES